MLFRDYEMFSENAGAVAFGWGQEEARNFGEFIRACATPEAIRHIYGALATVDVTDLLHQVRAETLVIHRPDLKNLPIEAAKELAALVPNARLEMVPGTYASPERATVIARFLEGDPNLELVERKASDPSAAMPQTGLTVILFADIVDSTVLTEQLGDAAFREKARDLDTALRTLIREHSGTPIEGKLLGDGVLATFSSARQAIEAAQACALAGDADGLPLHLGLHAGDVIREDNNVFGGAVNIAARISGLSAPGEVLVSQTVRDLARTSAGVSFEDRGEHALKGVGDPVRVWAVREAE
jgi:class 3 adenylate cyclase